MPPARRCPRSIALARQTSRTRNSRRLIARGRMTNSGLKSRRSLSFGPLSPGLWHHTLVTIGQLHRENPDEAGVGTRNDQIATRTRRRHAGTTGPRCFGVRAGLYAPRLSNSRPAATDLSRATLPASWLSAARRPEPTAGIESGLRAAGKSACHHRQRRVGSGARRADQTTRRRRRQTAGGSRSHACASAQDRLRRRRILCAVLG